MKKIVLTQGKFALVDDVDFEWLNQWKWCCSGNGAVHRNIGGQKRQYMHRLIMNNPERQVIDHINGNRLDNQRNNLRSCSQQENTFNGKTRKNNRSGYKDIWWDMQRKKWFVQIMRDGKKYSIGRFIKLEEAIEARNRELYELHGDFSRTEMT